MDQKHIPRPAQYLGDAVYMQEGRFPGEIILTTDSHHLPEAGHVIYIDPSYVQNLCNYMLSVQPK